MGYAGRIGDGARMSGRGVCELRGSEQFVLGHGIEETIAVRDYRR
jgi:hypothetical protein